MNDLFINILFAHILADFFFQPAWMATKKGSSNWLCVLHCLIYATCICAFVGFSFALFSFVFFSHYIVDRYSLADKWLRLIQGRDLQGFLESGHTNIPINYQDGRLNYHILRGGFSTICYVVVDNFMHLMSMYWFCINFL